MFTLNCNGMLFQSVQPVLMGIINVTPDSFFADSREPEANGAVRLAGKMLGEGAAIVDIGGQSTRPGSSAVNAEEEARRVVGPIRAIRHQYPEAIISVDTFYASVARAAITAGASMVNDISGGHLDPAMLDTVAAGRVPYICMHMKGTPQTMTRLASYDNVTLEVLDYFIERTAACTKAGIHDVILDPGFGFAKTIAQNFRLLREMDSFSILQKPVLAGLSRKGTIYKTLGVTAEASLNGTTVLNTIALQKGASILRVHDVRAAAEAITLFCAMEQA